MDIAYIHEKIYAIDGYLPMRWVEYDHEEVPFSMDKYSIHGSAISMGTKQHRPSPWENRSKFNSPPPLFCPPANVRHHYTLNHSRPHLPPTCIQNTTTLPFAFSTPAYATSIRPQKKHINQIPAFQTSQSPPPTNPHLISSHLISSHLIYI